MKRNDLHFSVKEKLVLGLAYIPLLAGLDTTSVWATTSNTGTGVTQVDTALSTLKTIMIGVVSAIGIIILVKNISDFAQSFQQQDSQGMHMAAKGIAAGVIMAAVGPVLTLLGF